MHLSDYRNRARQCIGREAPGHTRVLGRGWKRAVALSAVGLAAIAAPIALAAGGGSKTLGSAPVARAAAAQAEPIRGGVHNPPYTRYANTTGIFAKNPTWTLREENIGHGGTAILGCQSPAGDLACLEAENLTGGLAFAFATNGNTGGEIKLANESGVPFTTNGHGVATGLNANFLQGKEATEFQLASQPAADATELGGQPASAYVTTGQLLFADVLAGPKEPTIKVGRGATAVTQAGTVYTVSFGTTNVSRCSYTASPQGEALTAGQLGVEAAAEHTSAVIVNAPKELTGGFDLQVVC